MLPLATPSPSPILIELVGGSPGAPWWGVPAVAGAFLLIGGYLTYFYNRRHDTRKALRDKQALWDADLLDKGAELLAAGESMRDIGTLILRRDAAAATKLVVERGPVAIAAFKIAYSRFDLVMPRGIEKAAKEYASWSLSLVLPPYQLEGQDLKVRRHIKAGQQLRSELRALRNLEPLPVPDIEPLATNRSAEAVTSMLVDELRSQYAHKTGSTKSAPNTERSSDSDDDEATSPVSSL